MKAIQVTAYGGPEVLQLKDIPNLKPGPEQVVVRVKAAGVNPVDTYMRSGQYSNKPPLPYTPGMDAAGTVEAVGSGVTHVKAGDRVYVYRSISGTYAEQVLCKASQVHTLPANVSFEQGAAIGVPYVTAYHALFLRGHSMPGEIVLVHGASGGVGTAAVQLAVARGMIVIGTAGTAKGKELVLKQGAKHVLDHHDPTYLDQLMKLTENRGVDAIIELAAHNNLAKDLKVLAKHGRVVVVGSRGPLEINPRDLMSVNGSIRGLTLLNVTDEELGGTFAALEAGLANGTLKPVIGQEIPLAEAARAHDAVMKPGSYGKIVLKV